MLKKILIALLAVIALVAVIGFFLPAKVTISRQVRIDRAPSMVFATIDSFQLFPQWSPWQHLDPNMKQTTEGPREGVGAKLVWSGNDKVGTGTQIITAVSPNQSVDSDIAFGGMGTAKSVMSLAADAKNTRVSWQVTMDMGMNPFMHYMGLFMDKAIGGDFASGLAQLKKLVEGMPDADIADLKVETVDVSPMPVLLVNESRPQADIGKGYAEGYTQIGKFMAKNKLKQAGAPVGIDDGMKGDQYAFEPGIPVDRGDVASADGVRIDKTYAGRALKTVHVGPYENLGATHQKLMAYLAAHDLLRASSPYFVFVDDPGKVPAAEVRTEVYAPIR